MFYLFIHANPKNGGQGIILIYREKETPWNSDEVKALNRKLFPVHFRKKNVIHYNETVTRRMVAAYQLRIEQGKSQRYSIEETFEDIDRDSRDRIFRSLFPELSELLEFSKDHHAGGLK